MSRRILLRQHRRAAAEREDVAGRGGPCVSSQGLLLSTRGDMPRFLAKENCKDINSDMPHPSEEQKGGRQTPG